MNIVNQAEFIENKVSFFKKIKEEKKLHPHKTDFIDSAKKKTSLFFVVGVYALLLGLALVLSHNVWDNSWRVIITILGWITLAKGLTYLFVGERAFLWIAGMMNYKAWYVGWGLVAIALGLYLTKIGFGS